MHCCSKNTKKEFHALFNYENYVRVMGNIVRAPQAKTQPHSDILCVDISLECFSCEDPSFREYREVEAWGKPAEVLLSCTLGMLIRIIGIVKHRKWEAKDIPFHNKMTYEKDSYIAKIVVPLLDGVCNNKDHEDDDLFENHYDERNQKNTAP